MSWSFSAHGLAQDEQAAARLLEQLRELFSDPEHGTQSTSFSGAGVSEANFHATAPTAEQPPELPPAPDTQAEVTPAEGSGQAEEQPAGSEAPAV